MALPMVVKIRLASNKTSFLQLSSTESNLLQFKEQGGDSKGIKHQVENSAQAGLFNIKCMETGKYWTLAGMHSNGIPAEADKPVEDLGSSDCTLIKLTVKEPDALVNFQFQKESKWRSIFVNSKTRCFESGENVKWDFVIIPDDHDRERSQRAHANTSTRGAVAFGGVNIEDGVFIGGAEDRGPGHFSYLSTNLGVGSAVGGGSTREGVSVADVNVNASELPAGGTFTFGERKIKGGIRLGYKEKEQK